MKIKQPVTYSYDSLVAMYGALIGDTVLIQPVNTTMLPEDALYDIIDVGYDMSMHFHKQFQTPSPRTKNLTRRNLTMKQCIQYAEFCIGELRRQSAFEYKQPYGGAKRRMNNGVKKVNESSSA